MSKTHTTRRQRREGFPRRALFMLVFAAAAAFSTQAYAQDALAHLRTRVSHIVVIYQENWSFDALYGLFPGANGIANASSVSLGQVGRDGTPLRAAPCP